VVSQTRITANVFGDRGKFREVLAIVVDGASDAPRRAGPAVPLVPRPPVDAPATPSDGDAGSGIAIAAPPTDGASCRLPATVLA
jgi:hypothetical protein